MNRFMIAFLGVLVGSAFVSPDTSAQACASTSQMLDSVLPRFSDQGLKNIRAKAVMFDTARLIKTAKERGATANQLVDRINKVATQYETQLSQAGQCSQSLMLAWKTDDAFVEDLKTNEGKYSAMDCDTALVADQCTCSAIAARMNAMSYRTAAAEVACLARARKF